MARRSLKYLLNRYTLSFRNRIVVIAVGMVICLLSLVYTNRMAHDLREKEQHDVEVWAHAMEQASRDAFGGSVNDPLIKGILSNRNNIPFIITDERLNVIQSHLVPREVLDHPDRLRRQIDRFTEENQPKTVNYWWGPEHRHIIFYGKSKLLKGLYLFPYVQLGVIFFFIFIGYIAFRSSKQDEQNRVWIGLAKETAHQLGTPTSSLLGWIEYLRSQPVDQEAVEEMNKDLTHLLKIVDRFSKIGSETVLQKATVNEVVGEAVMYFRKRIPRNARLQRAGHRSDRGQHQSGALRMGGREPDEKCARRPARTRVDRRAALDGRPKRDDRREGYGQGHSQKQLEADFRARLHDQDARLGARTVALAPYHRGVSQR